MTLKIETLKIEKLPREHGTTLKLIGRIRAEHLAELRGQIAASAPNIVLDLGEVTLVDADVVRFLSTNLNEEKAANTKLTTVALRKGVNTKATAA